MWENANQQTGGVRDASHRVDAIDGNGWHPYWGAIHVDTVVRWCHSAQPPATSFHASGMRHGSSVSAHHGCIRVSFVYRGFIVVSAFHGCAGDEDHVDIQSRKSVKPEAYPACSRG